MRKSLLPNSRLATPHDLNPFEAPATLLGMIDADEIGGKFRNVVWQIGKANAGKWWLWINRISNIPEWFIKDSVNAAKPYGVSSDEAMACVEFLIRRRKRLKRLIMDNKSYFPNIQEMKLPGMLL